MKQADPTILCGVNANSQGDWEKLLTGAAAQIGFPVGHTYPAWTYRNYSSYSGKNINPIEAVDAAWNALQKYPAHKDRIKLAMTETGGITYGIRGSRTQADLGHALMNFVFAQLQQDPRIEFSQFWNTHWIEQNAAGNVWPN